MPEAGNFEIKWHDGGLNPKLQPNPAFPNGVDVDLSGGAIKTCKTALTYPARRIGGYSVHCLTCGLRVYVSTAGRNDDPRSVKLPCRN
jgi:hypothetical protein